MQLVFIVRKDAEQAVSGRAHRHLALQVNGDGHHEAQIVVCVFSNQIHPSGSAEHPGSLEFGEVGMENFGYDALRASQSNVPPKTAILEPT